VLFAVQLGALLVALLADLAQSDRWVVASQLLARLVVVVAAALGLLCLQSAPLAVQVVYLSCSSPLQTQARQVSVRF